ncbi:DUF305 domain-containing protein [Mycolicibacterium litorale]|nr:MULTISPECIES: DUF305 domain-containing protein [Mycolicibacterium]
MGDPPPRTSSPGPAAEAPSVAVASGEHPLAADSDVRRVTGANGAGAAGPYLDVMIKQHRFTISAARDHLQAGSNPRAMANARSLIKGQQFEMSLMTPLQR